GMPDGVFSILTGPGDRLGRAFLEAGFGGLVFTGSKAIGVRVLSGFVGDYPKPAVVGVGGKNPSVVTARGELEEAAEARARSALGYGGQKRSACSRAYVERAVYGRFREAIEAVTRGMKVGDPLRREVSLGPLINERALDAHRGALDEARRD